MDGQGNKSGLLSFFNKSNKRVKQIFLLLLIINACLIFVWNVSSDDLYSYIFQGRVLSKYGQNPYLVAYDNFPKDVLYDQIKTVWTSETVLYGPLFLLFSGALTFLGGDSFFLNVFLFKLMFAALNIGIAYFLYLATKDKLALVLFGLSPLVVFEFSMNSHTETVMIFFLTLALYLAFKGENDLQRGLGVLAFTAAILVKYSPLVIFPLYLLLIYGKSKTKFKTIWLSLLASAGLVVLSLAPFWEGPEIFDSLAQISKSQYPFPSVGIFLLNKMMPFLRARRTAIWIYVALLAFVFLKYLKDFRKDKSGEIFLKYSLINCSGFYLLYLNLFLPWYGTVLIFLLSAYSHFLKNKKWILITILVFTLYCFFLYFYI